MTGAEVIEVTVADGTRLPVAVRRADRRDPAPTLVLIHGYTDSWRSYEAVVPLLPDRFDIVVPTLRGHGDADRPATGYTPTSFAADVREVLLALGIDRAVVAGMSLGAAVACRFAVQFPDMLDGLVLIAGFARPAENPMIAELGQAVAELSDPVPPEFGEEFQRSTIVSHVPDDFVDAMIAETRKVPAHVWQAVNAGFVTTDNTAGLDTVTAPALVLSGALDDLAGADAPTLAAALPNAVAKVYENTGHAIHWERPDQFARDVTEFVERVYATAAAH